MTKKLTYTEIYTITDNLIKEYQAEGTSNLRKHTLLLELLDVTKPIVMKNCKTVKYRKGGLFEYDVEELYNEAIGLPLTRALSSYDSSNRAYFMKWWFIKYMGHFGKMVEKESTHTAKFNKYVDSLDKESFTKDKEDGFDEYSHIESEQASRDLMACEDKDNVSYLLKLLGEFEKQSSRGWIIRAELEGKLLNISRADSVRLSKAKADFKQFLIAKGVLMPKWFEGRGKQRRTKKRELLTL